MRFGGCEAVGEVEGVAAVVEVGGFEVDLSVREADGEGGGVLGLVRGGVQAGAGPEEGCDVSLSWLVLKLLRLLASWCWALNFWPGGGGFRCSLARAR